MRCNEGGGAGGANPSIRQLMGVRSLWLLNMTQWLQGQPCVHCINLAYVNFAVWLVPMFLQDSGLEITNV